MLAGLGGLRLRAALPGHDLVPETKDAIRVAMGLVATMTALVLGLLVASTKGGHDTERSEVTLLAARIDYVDALLSRYGPRERGSNPTARSHVDGN